MSKKNLPNEIKKKLIPQLQRNLGNKPFSALMALDHGLTKHQILTMVQWGLLTKTDIDGATTYTLVAE